MMIIYDTVSEAISGLKARGYTLDFNLTENCLVCDNDKFNVSDFEITEIHRFEGDSDPADEAILFAIESKNGVKGVLVNGYGISADSMSSEMVQKLGLYKSGE